MNTLVIKDLHKSFGENKVLDGLSLTVKDGSVYGFIGQNGAGKTTTMKTILGLIKADSGKISVCGEQVRYGRTPTNKYIGYLPDVPAFYGYMRPKEYLNLCGEITGLTKRVIQEKSGELLKLVGLEGNNRRISGFSRGMKQRLGIAQALLSEPRLLICDEPTSALDPAGRKEILDILESVKEKTTVLFSTHILSDVERICDTVAVLNQGKIVLSGSLADIRNRHKQDTLFLEFPDEKTAACFSEIIFKNKMQGRLQGASVTVRTNTIHRTEAEILAILSEKKLLPVKFEIEEPTLESLFLEVIE